MSVRRCWTACLLLAAIASSAGAARAAGPLVVRDSAGAAVGTVIAPAADANRRYELPDDSLIWMASAVPGAVVRLLVGVNGPWETKELTPLQYESEDCTGLPLVESSDDPAAPRTAVLFDTEIYWAEGPGAPRVIRSRASLVRDPADCSATLVAPKVCCATLRRGETVTAAPVTGDSLSSVGLRPPFRVDDGRE